MWQAALNKLFKVREKVALNLNKEDEEKPFLEHLEDLRKMFVRIFVTLIISVIGTFAFYKQLFQVILKPLRMAGFGEQGEKLEGFLTTLSPQEAFMTAVNISLIAAIILSFPLLLLFVLQFVLPGLRHNEKRVLWPAIGIGAGLFLLGVFFSYFVVLPRALEFFAEFAESMGVRNDWRLGEYITFATRFILIFGVSFELPVVVMALVKLDFLSYKVMQTTRKHAIIGIAIFSAIITPTQDVLTLLLLAGPLYVLYEICIWLAWFLEKKERQMYPEFYAERDKDEAELEKEIDEWDKDDYTPWFSDEEDDDIEDEYQQRAKTGDPSASSPAASAPPSTGEKSLEELAREDEQSGASNHEATSSAPPGDPARNDD